MNYVKPEAEVLVFEDSNGFMTTSGGRPTDPYTIKYDDPQDALTATCGSAFHISGGNLNSGFSCSSFGTDPVYGPNPPKGATVKIGNDEYYYTFEVNGSGKWKKR